MRIFSWNIAPLSKSKQPPALDDELEAGLDAKKQIFPHKKDTKFPLLPPPAATNVTYPAANNVTPPFTPTQGRALFKAHVGSELPSPSPVWRSVTRLSALLPRNLPLLHHLRDLLPCLSSASKTSSSSRPIAAAVDTEPAATEYYITLPATAGNSVLMPSAAEA
ncbi:hypothetical protein OCU04_005761 [Sclerotinia nivalis]|uniref:Uncharacterized protein n=1 Tax=Sclerotinia nivalis TaxID=352851 RepID=A0A9X0ALM3_9HELO|nr:hypothetical protein OCU04_005761 [Sclerotinia nivalis]